MPKLQNSIRINASPEKVWQILGDPLATPQWIPGLTSAKMVGDSRVCRTMDGTEIEEQVQYSDQTRSFRYLQRRVPLPIHGSRGTMRVEQASEGSSVIWDAEFEVLDPTQEAQITQMIDGYYRQTLESLRSRVESSP